jgi:hypothetical protein
MKSDSDSVSQPQQGEPQIPVDGATNQLVARFSRLYAEAGPEDQLAVRVWIRDIILGRKVGSANTVRARRSEKRMVEACERRILEFPLGAWGDFDDSMLSCGFRRQVRGAGE